VYEFIRGILIASSPSKAIVEAGGVGYALEIPLSTFSSLPALGETLLLYVSFLVREDEQRLFGFLSLEERNLFETIRTVSGIGPKTALSLIGHLPRTELERAILQGSASHLTRVPGIGKKIAERLIVELKDKLGKPGQMGSSPLSTTPTSTSDLPSDAISALINLGYPPLAASEAVRKAQEEGGQSLSLPLLITRSLRHV